MGIVRMGPPAELVSSLRREYGINVFVETGTYRGQTAAWASSEFPVVKTIENSELIYQQTSRELGNISNINFLFGHAKEKLGEIVSGLEGSAIFWLDAHWSGGETYGMGDECPVLEEIRMINQSKFPHFIFIDDARLFTSPPPPPHEADHWPDISTLLKALHEDKTKRYVVIIEDVIIAVPDFAKSHLTKYCQKVALETLGKSAPTRKLKDGLKLILEGARSLGR